MSIEEDKYIFTRYFENSEQPSSIKHHRYSNGDLLIYVGTSITKDKREFSPSSGNLYIMKIDTLWAEGEKEFRVNNIHQIKLNGAILEIQTMFYL